MYQVWTKEGYEEAWKLTECPDLDAVEAIIRAKFGTEASVRVSVPVEFDAKVAVKIHAPKDQPNPPPPAPPAEPEKKQEAKGETTKSKAKPDKMAS